MSIISAGTSNTTSLVYTGDTTGAMVFQTNGTTEAMRITSGGNVGIGTTSPIAKLDVRGSGAYFYDNSTTDFQLTVGSSISTIGTTTATPLAFKTNVTERMRIDSSGRVTMPFQPAFRATKNNGSGSSGTGVIVFNQVDTNIGSCYNNSNGLFTAPVSGMYQLNFTGITNNTSTDMTIEVNATAVCWTYNFFTQTYANMTMSVATYMSAGDSARVFVKSGNVFDATDGGSPRFSGFLIG